MIFFTVELVELVELMRIRVELGRIDSGK